MTRQLIILLAMLFCLTVQLHCQSPFPFVTSGFVQAQYLRPIILSIESTTSTSFVINALVRSIAPRRDIVCFRYVIASDSSFTNILQRDLRRFCMPPLPNCLNRGYLDSAVFFQVKIASLEPSRQYFVRLFSQSTYSDADFHSTDVFINVTLPSVSVPERPIIIRNIPSITTTSANIRWVVSEGLPTEYRLSVATDSAFQNLLPQYADIRLNTTSLLLTGLQAQTSYFVRVRALNNVGTSDFSPIVRFQTLAASASQFSAENRSSALGFPNAGSLQGGSAYYRLNTGAINIRALDSLITLLVQRNIPIVEAWAQDNSTCSPNQVSASELVIRLREPQAILANLGYTQSPPTWADSCSCKTFRVYSNFPTSTGIDMESFSLFTLSPNPSIGTVNMAFSLSSSSPVRIVMFDALGREVRTLAEGIYPTGQSSVSFSTEDLPSGIYFVRCDIGGQVVVRRLAVVR